MAGTEHEAGGPHGGCRPGDLYHSGRSDGSGDPGRSAAVTHLRSGRYVWLPESGASVLVIKGGPGGEEQCVCGGKQAEVPKGMQPGEVYIYGPKGSNVYLQKDGTIELTGRISIRGQLLINGQPYKPRTCGEGGIL